MSNLIIDLYKHKRLDGFFDKNDESILKNNTDVVDITLDKEFLEYMKKTIEF